jgi:hypothetical protein
MRILATIPVLMGLMAVPHMVAAQARTSATLYKNPQCDCCEGHAAYLREHGYDVNVVVTNDLPMINRQHGVPEQLEGCHTILVGGYVVEGHVSARTIDRLLHEKPKIIGISLPGMPAGVPGMGGRKTGPLTVYEIGPGTPKVYAVE